MNVPHKKTTLEWLSQKLKLQTSLDAKLENFNILQDYIKNLCISKHGALDEDEN